MISPYHIGGLQLAQTALRPAVVDFVQLATTSENLDLNLEQVHIAAGSPLDGRTLVEAGSVSALAWLSSASAGPTARWTSTPAETTMRAGDDLVVLGRAGSLRELES